MTKTEEFIEFIEFVEFIGFIELRETDRDLWRLIEIRRDWWRLIEIRILEGQMTNEETADRSQETVDRMGKAGGYRTRPYDDGEIQEADCHNTRGHT